MALSAKDLRIGNLITRKNKVLKVCIIQPDKILVSGYSWGKYFKCDEIEPILLTEEWLFKFGFEKAKHSHGYDCYIKDGFDFDIVSHGRYWVLAIYTDESCTNSLYFAHGRFEYVHQLQNLYFALTGEELTI